MITKESIVPQIDIVDINPQKCEPYLGVNDPIIITDPYQNEQPAPVRIKTDQFGNSPVIKTDSITHALCIAAELKSPGCAPRAQQIFARATEGLNIRRHTRSLIARANYGTVYRNKP